jgi:hypothetical protein
MRTRHRRRVILLWLAASALLSGFLFFGSKVVLESAVREQLQAHLLLTLDEAQFSNAHNRENDQRALLRMGTEINAALQNIVEARWYSPLRDCAVQVLRIDDVAIVDAPMRGSITLSLPRNQIEREVVVGVSCTPNWPLAAAASGLLGLLFFAIHRLFPQPLSKVHQRWLDYLLERGYSEAQAIDILRGFDKASLDLNPAQLACLEQLHDIGQRNFGWALQVAGDDRVAALQGDAIDWFALGLRGNPADLESALALANAEDGLAIDLIRMTLHLHGLNIPVGGTPLFYYAWYAMARSQGEGWITNPATNRPDLVAGEQLIALMSRFHGHARAINDLERTGLKARTLDQNRSKIKDDIVAVLGEKLAAAYLFETSKHPDGVHMRYRLQAEAHRIRVHL